MLSGGYIWWMTGSALICAGFHFFLTKGLKKRGLLTGLTLLLGVALGAVCAKLLYCALAPQYFLDDVRQFGLWQALVSDDMTKLAFYGGVAGAIFGAALCGVITGNGAMSALNAWAPAGALMAALARFGEGFLGTLGAGRAHMDAEWTHFFLLAVPNSRRTVWYLAVYSLAGLAYLVVCAVSLWRFREKRFVRTLFYLCLPQIMLESLRNMSLIFHEFVRVEQLLCMIVMIVILVLYGVWAGKGQRGRFMPAVLSMLIAGVFVAVEFALDGKLGESLRYGYPYAVMGLGLIALAALECRGFERLKKAAACSGETVKNAS